MTLKDNLIEMKRDLNNHNRDRKQLIIFYVSKRLSESLDSYYYDLRDSVKYLNHRKPDNVLRKF